MSSTNSGLIHRGNKTLLVAEKVTAFSNDTLGHIGRAGQLFEGEQVMMFHMFGAWTDDTQVDKFAALVHHCTTTDEVTAWVKDTGAAARIITATKVYNFTVNIPGGFTVSYTLKDTLLDWWWDQGELYALLKPYITGAAELQDAYKDEALNQAFELVTVVDHNNPKYGLSK